MGGTSDRALARTLLERHGKTYAEESGIRMRDTPQPLYQTLVLAHLLSARIRASVAVASARALFDAGLRSPRRMADATWQHRVDALGAGGYRRYDERTSTQLGDAAELLLEEYGGDLRRMRDAAGGDLEELRSALRKVPGLGSAGSDIFLREVQGVWPEISPYLDGKAVQGAERLGLPTDSGKLARLVEEDDVTGFASALVRASLDKSVVDEVRQAADG
ncbi:endonuclease [Streptomyces sp. NA02950]|uniref:endonuclease n=1 Tax=Streptomyces sp. NA02950 TaxID=2742137 RepID=UPI001592922B|nr:endonuclease [Streptomyces sp. NA02950]QKV90668.1 endonuclease [Streptomyces sp. NA02950]